MRLLPPRVPDHLVPDLDPVQAEFVARPQGSGPVVLFGAPGTGKTTALVEAVAARVARDGLAPSSVLAWAPTRQAAARLRERLAARIGGTLREPVARTPHSYAFGVLRAGRVLDGEPPPRLISGAEQDRVLAELLAGHRQDSSEGFGAPDWPAAITEQILGLRGFRDELRDLLMRAVERGLAPVDLSTLGRDARRPEWPAAAEVLAEYLDVTALSTPGAYDSAGIVDAAAGLLSVDEGLLAAEHRSRRLVVVDDAQELTVASHRLLAMLAGGGPDVLLAGDPDTATQTFRGARARGLVDLAELLEAEGGRSVARLRLPVAHRHGGALRTVAARVSDRIGTAGAAGHRQVVPAAGPDGRPRFGEAVVRVLGSPARQAAYIAQYLRRHHLEGGLSWRDMGVVVRSAADTAGLRRALGAAGVPVAVPASQVPVRDEPAVVPLRLVLACSLDPERLDSAVAAELLTGPVGGADGLALRRLRQALRGEELAGGGGRASDALLVEALHQRTRLAGVDPGVAAYAHRVAVVLEAGRAAVEDERATPETVLWAIWTATGLARSWHRSALAGGAAGRRADRDLDAVMALFEVAARFTDRFPRAGAAGFLEYLEGQELADDTLAEQAPSDDAVALVTAQGAAGLEWDVVAVAGVQEGTWPDLRLRDTLLGAQQVADELDGRSEGGYPARRKAVLDDELRLFHVAVSRARRHLLVTAVRSDDEMPSAFIDLVDPDGAQDEIRPLAEVPRTMTLPALVAELRAAVTAPHGGDARRRAAARQLARLMEAGVPGADPEDWYGLAPVSVEGALRPLDARVRVSPSAVESYERCSLRWLLEQSGGRSSSSAAQGVGVLVHELAHEVPDGDETRLRELLDERFGRLGLGTGWVADSERARAERMVGRLVDYVQAARAAGRELVATEQRVVVDVDRAEVRGTVDRLERDDEGRLVIIDLKTGKTPPTAKDVAANPQLGVYQVAVEEGGFADVAGGARESGGAALAQLGKSGAKLSVQPQPPLSDAEDPHWARTLLTTVADGMAGENFDARTNPMCRVCPLRTSCPLQNEGRQVVE